MAANSRLRRSLDTALCAVFVAGLFAAALDFAVRPMAARSPAREQRLATRPPGAIVDLATLLGWPARAERWWNDWFGLRDVLIGARNELVWRVFELAPTAQVVRGRDGWIFFDGINHALEADRGALPLSRASLAAWKRTFEARRAWCEARGIQLVVAIVPSKARVYPDLLPRGYETIGPSRAEQVRAELGPAWDDAWVELESTLARERELDTPDDPAFAPLGTHWTDRAGFAAYRAIVAAIARRHPGLEALTLADFDSVPDPTGGDSWAARMYLDDVLEQRTRVLRPKARRAVADQAIDPTVRDATFRCERAPLAKAYVLHDSFGPDARAWVAEHFRETRTRWQYDFEPREIEAFAPDVLVMLFSDRYFVLIEPVLGADELEDARKAGLLAAPAQRLLMSFDAERDASRVHVEGKLSVARVPEGLALDVGRGSDWLGFPAFEAGEGGPLQLRIVLDSPAETTLDVFFKTRAVPRFTRVQTVPARLHAGTNEVELELSAADVLGELGLRPGVVPGRYVLRAFEVRR